MQAFEKAPPEVKELLGKRIKELGLRLEGSPVERFVQQLYRELDRKSLRRFRPICYLTDEWGCPSGEPVIGIPFYLASPQVASLEKLMNDLEDEREIMMYLRHEAGHAFNYAHVLYTTPEWRAVFGEYNRPYRDNYRPVPFSRKFVRHIAGWYAQKHPDEDFAETFAVWLTPRSKWRRRYRGWPAMRKLNFVERTARRLAESDPAVGKGQFDITVEQMEMTLEEFYRETELQGKQAADLAMTADLADIFFPKGRRRKGIRRAVEIIEENRLSLTDKITRWTGVPRPVVRSLVESLARHCDEQNLWAESGGEAAYLVELTAYGTTLAMNYLTRGKFVPS
ncbi:MAG: hypothetical protein DMF49_04815 [Acidobacteria bacterium]|nr:MAG: hypothetical protein DMF49_04815 [Acidobacteriota bacterium]